MCVCARTQTQHAFSLVTPDAKVTFAATSAVELDQWLRRLRSAQTATQELAAQASVDRTEVLDVLNIDTHPDAAAAALPVGGGMSVPMLATIV